MRNPDFQLEPDPVIEAYKNDVDRTLIRENLKLIFTTKDLLMEASCSVSGRPLVWLRQFKTVISFHGYGSPGKSCMTVV